MRGGLQGHSEVDEEECLFSLCNADSNTAGVQYQLYLSPLSYKAVQIDNT